MPSTNGINFYYPDSDTHVLYAYGTNLFPTFSSGEGIFAKRDTKFYLYSHNSGVAEPNKRVLEFDAVSGVQLNEWDSIADFDIGQMAATADFLYCLGTTQGDANGQALKRIDRATGLVTGTFMLDNISPNALGLVSDDLIYVVCNGTPVALYYIENFTDLVFVGYTPGQGLNPFGFATGAFVNGAMYFGSSGFGGFSVDIFRITVECPDGGAVIASVSRDASSVAAGSPINVSWADVLTPDAGDTIQLHSAPAGDDLGFTGASLIDSQPTDGLGTSSIVYTIPGGTPAGTYVFTYAALDSIYVAISPTFTVT